MSTTAPLPASVGIENASRRLDPDFQGVSIFLADRATEREPLVIHGSFRIPWPDAEPIEPPRHRALVLVVISARGHAALTPFREQVLFEDDDEATRSGAVGHFTLRVADLLGVDTSGAHFLAVSLGPHVSNVIHARVT